MNDEVVLQSQKLHIWVVHILNDTTFEVFFHLSVFKYVSLNIEFIPSPSKFVFFKETCRLCGKWAKKLISLFFHLSLWIKLDKSWIFEKIKWGNNYPERSAALTEKPNQEWWKKRAVNEEEIALPWKLWTQWKLVRLWKKASQILHQGSWLNVQWQTKGWKRIKSYFFKRHQKR